MCGLRKDTQGQSRHLGGTGQRPRGLPQRHLLAGHGEMAEGRHIASRGLT